jgi:hypothetical protein
VTSLVAAAARYTATTAKTTAKTTSIGRQRTAWDHYAAVPEVRSYANWVGNAMSRCLLRAGRVRADGTVQAAPSAHPASDYVAQIAGGLDGRRQLLREYGRHLSVAGEGWTVITPTSTGLAWHVLSVLEVSGRGGSGLEATIDGEPVKIPPADDGIAFDAQAPVAIRVWDPDPKAPGSPPSPANKARPRTTSSTYSWRSPPPRSGNPTAQPRPSRSSWNSPLRPSPPSST